VTLIREKNNGCKGKEDRRTKRREKKERVGKTVNEKQKINEEITKSLEKYKKTGYKQRSE